LVDAAKMRVEYYLLLQKDKAQEAEIDRMINIAPTPLDSSRYAVLHDLAGKFYTASKRAAAKPEDSGSNRSALAALMIYEKLYEISRENEPYSGYCDPIQLRMAQICMNENRVDRAAAFFADILQRNPQSADAVYGLGLIYERWGQWQKALNTWRKFSNGVEAGTYHWFQSRYRTANALHQLGKTEKACAVTTMTLVLHPHFDDDELKKLFLDFKSERCRGSSEMKKTILMTFSIIFASACSMSHVELRRHYWDADETIVKDETTITIIKRWGRYPEEISNGPHRSFYPNGNLKVERNYTNNK
jgi:tetratricopeptide (TPR) repeat protein